MGGLKKGKSGGKSKGKGTKSDGRKEAKRPQAQDETQRDVLLPLQERVAAVKPFWETLSQEDRVRTLTVSLADLRARAAEAAERQRKQAAAEEALYPGEALAIDLEPSIEELLETGLGRLQAKPTWKLWQWLPEQREFLDADSFREYVESEHIEPGLRALLPKEEGKPVEKPAEAALRTRMSELLQRVHAHNRQLQEEPAQAGGGKGAAGKRAPRATADQLGAAVRDSNIELINLMMEALEQEHEFLHHAVLFPITGCVCELLEEGQRESSCMDLCYEDLEKLHPDDVARICEWLTEKVDGFSSKIKPEAKDVEEEEEEEGIGDVDLFSLTPDRQHLAVNERWLRHLQERVLGEDGQPRRMKEGEDPFHMGLVLEWVYGTIVSTAEKARDGAKRALVAGARPPTATAAHDQLVQALREQASWERRARDARELLQRMLTSRKEAAALAAAYDTRPAAPRPAPGPPGGGGEAPAGEPPLLPDSVVAAMLRREVLLTEAKLHALDYELVTSDRKLRQLRSQLRQGEPEFERLKRELEEVKNQPRGLEGTFRSAAEMERHRAQMADAAIEEQLEVQTAFREHGARLQGIYDRRQRTEMEVARKEQEIKQLKGWRQTVQSLIDRFQELAAAGEQPPAAGEAEHAGANGHGPGAHGGLPNGGAEPTQQQQQQQLEAQPPAVVVAHHAALEAASRSLTGTDAALAKLRTHFQKDVRRQLYGDDDDRTFFDWIRAEARAIEKRLEDGRAVLHHLQMALINTACHDPGAPVGAGLLLPLLQDRLDGHAHAHAAQRAAEAEEAIIRMEEENAERERQERKRRQKLRAKAKERLRSEKEREKAGAQARAAAQQAQEAESAAQEAAREERSRRQAREAQERARREQEAQMEARRRELLSEEDGYWRRRMAQDAAHAALAGGAGSKAALPDDGPAHSSGSDQTSWQGDDAGFQDGGRPQRRARGGVGRRRPEEEPAHVQAQQPRANGGIEDPRALHRLGREAERPQPRENGHGPVVPPRERRPRPAGAAASRSSSSSGASEEKRSPPALSPQRAPASEQPPPPLSAAAQAQPPPPAAAVAPAAVRPSAAEPPPPAPQPEPAPEQSGAAPPAPAAAPAPEAQAAEAKAPLLAPGTPAQQAPQALLPPPLPAPEAAPARPPPPPVPAPVPVPASGGGVIFMQPPPHAGPPPPQLAGPPPPPPPHEAGYGPRREAPPHLPYGQPGPLPQGMPNGPLTQARRPGPGPPRGEQPPFQRGFPPGGVGYPVLPLPPPPGGEPQAPPPQMLVSTPFPPAGPGAPPLVYGGPPAHAKAPGTAPVPQHVFVGNMVAPPYAMLPMQMPRMQGPQGPPLHYPGSSLPQPQPQQAHVFPLPNGLPHALQQPHPQQHPRGRYSRGGSPPPPAAQPHHHKLRASAPSFVPGGLRPPQEPPLPPAQHERPGSPAPAQLAGTPQPQPAAPARQPESAQPAGAAQQQEQQAAPHASASAEPVAEQARSPPNGVASPLARGASPAAPQAQAAPDGAPPQAPALQQQQQQQQPKWSAVASATDHAQAGAAARPEPGKRAGTPPPPLPQQQQQQQPAAAAPRAAPAADRAQHKARSAGDKRKITRAGGVTWEGLQGELHRLTRVRGLSNEAGRNNCFLNVVIQALWHLPCFRDGLLRLQPQALESRGAPAEDQRVLRALWNVFDAFSQPREELAAAGGGSGGGGGGGGPAEEADAKRAKREGQGDAAAAKVARGWVVSPAELREALASASRGALRFDATDMHDAAEVLDCIFSSLHRAELGRLADGEPDAALPQRVRLPPGGAAGGGLPPRRRPRSVVEAVFGLDVRVPLPAEDEGEAQAVKRSRGTGGAVVGRWQETAPRGRSAAGGSPKAQQPPPQQPAPPARKPPGVVEMLQFTKLYHLVPAQGLKLAHDHLVGQSFEALLREADVAEALGHEAGAAARADRTSQAQLLERPRALTLAIGWDSPQAPADAIHAVIDALRPEVDAGRVFKSAPPGPPARLRALVGFFGHHYKAFALSEELGEWLLLDDTTIARVGGWRDVTAALRAARLQPSLLFYEQAA